jgi:DNA topoisomerase IA
VISWFFKVCFQIQPAALYRGGDDAGDHPPITPMEAATESRIGGGDAWRLYDFITRHFIASLSPDCKYASQRVVLSVAGEKFSVTGQSVLAPGWTLVMPHRQGCPPGCQIGTRRWVHGLFTLQIPRL